MAIEQVRDNQWWYSQSVHRPRVESCRFVLLSIGGRECPLIHSELGRDGRTTHSFKFLSVADRTFWETLRGRSIDIELIECGDEVPEVDQADEDDLTEEVASEQKSEAHSVFRRSETLFDAYMFVDWSASSRAKTGTDSIWIGTGSFDSNGVLVVDPPANLSTRRQAEIKLEEMLLEHSRRKRRVLVGFDFPYGYPINWHIALGQNAGDWRTLWNLLVGRVSDDARNKNNRCEVADALNAAIPEFSGPYWSRPNSSGSQYPSLPATKPSCLGTDVVEFREIERKLLESRRRPKSVWQLFGNGVVASQALLGIPVLHRLRNNRQLSEHSRVWPFETGWLCPSGMSPFILHAEIWPGAIPVSRELHAIKDAAQMLSYVYWAASLDVAGDLSSRFCPRPMVSAPYVQDCEGWILGD
jgi:hypothetical protein